MISFFVLLVSVWTSDGVDNTLSVHKSLAECETVAAIIDNDYAYIPDNPLIQTECRGYSFDFGDIWSFLNS